MNWFLKAVRQYADFSGRARRSEYWYFALFYLLFSIAAAVIDGALGTYNEATGVGLVGGLLALGLLLPSIGVSVRRLHDIGRTGWWLLIAFIPLIGFIVLIVFAIQDSQPGDNAYGPNPKGVTV